MTDEPPSVKVVRRDRKGRVIGYEYQNYDEPTICECTEGGHGRDDAGYPLGCDQDTKPGERYCEGCPGHGL